MFNWCPLVVRQSETQSNNAPWLWTPPSFAPITLLLDGEMGAALLPLVYRWITACDLWWEGVLKREWNSKWWQTNTHITGASSSVSGRMPLIPCQCSAPSLSDTVFTNTRGGEWITSIITAPPFQGPLPQRPKWQAGKHGLALPKQPYQSVTHCYTSFQFLHNTRILQSGASMYGTHYVCICVLMCGCVSAPLLDSECMRPVHAYSCFWIQECTHVHLQNTKTKWPRTVVKEVPWLLSPHG